MKQINLQREICCVQTFPAVHSVTEQSTIIATLGSRIKNIVIIAYTTGVNYVSR